MIKTIIFDFDGVIVDSMEIKAQAFASVFKNYPEHIDEIVEFHLTHGGLSRFEKFKWIYNDILHIPLSGEEMHKLDRKFSAFVYQRVLRCPFVKGAYEFLNKYYRRINLFLVSGTPEEEIKVIVRERNLEGYFKGIFGAPDGKRSINLRILEAFNLRPEEVIFVGDSIDDFEGTEGTGIRFIGRVGEKNPFPMAKIEGLVSDMFDLERIVSKEAKLD